MKIVELKREIDAQFREVDARFRDVDVRFRGVDGRFNEVDARFNEVDRRFDQIDARFAAVDIRFDALESRLSAEHETTRHYMDVLIEQVKAEYRLGLEKMTAIEQRLAGVVASNASEHATLTAILQQHEVRITALEADDKP